MAQFNGDFETDTSGWGPQAGGTITRQTTVAHTGSASALVATGGASGDGAIYTHDAAHAAQSTTWTLSGYVQAHAVGDVGAVVNIRVATTGGTGELFDGGTVTLAQGWTFTTVDAAFVQASHTAAQIVIRQNGAHAAFNVDADTFTYARHLTYLPASNPFVSGLWLPGVPAGNYNEPTDAKVTTLTASGLYAGA